VTGIKSNAGKITMLILILSLSLVVLDQFTKHLIRSNMMIGDMIPVIPSFFSITYIRNTGAAWGMLSGLNSLLIALSVVMLTVLIIFRRSFITDTLIHKIAAGLMLAGIIGNMIDRVRLSYVVDFLHFYIGKHQFPSFNVADSAICIGVTLYIISQLFEKKQIENNIIQ
jgi:signal peptidase II